MKRILILVILFTTNTYAGEAAVSSDQYGEKWPFTVSEGIVKCKKYQSGNHILDAVTFLSEGKEYAINGHAITVSKDSSLKINQSIDSIWKEDPKYNETVKELAVALNKSEKEIRDEMGSPMRVSISPVLDKGLKLCN